MLFTHSQETHNSIKALSLNGVSTADIVQRTGVSKWTVNRLKTKLNPSYKRPSGGRTSNLSTTTAVTLRFKVRYGSLPTARAAHQWLKHNHINISYRRTIQILYQLGLYATLKKSKPFLRYEHMKKRLYWAKKYKEWTIEDWKKVIFLDETKINLWGSDGVQYTWKQRSHPTRPHHYKQTLKHGGGSLLMWGCMTAEGLGYACKIEDKTLDSEGYTYILGTTYMDTSEYYGWSKEDVILQQDGDTKHTSKFTRKWLETKGINYMHVWSPNSPDLNPIEHLWHHLKIRLAEYPTHPKNINELWNRIDKEWNKFQKEDMLPYYESMPSRVQVVIKAKGGYTKY